MLRVPRTLWILLLAGLLLRIFMIELRPPGALGRASDEREYLTLADHVAHGQGFTLNEEPTADRDMFYPVFAAVIMRIAGGAVKALFYVQAILSCVAAWLFYRIATRRFGSGAGQAAAVLWLFYPAAVLSCSLFLTATLFIFLCAVCLELFDRLEENGFRLTDALLLGVVTGLTILTRSGGIVLLAAFVVHLALLRYGHLAPTHWKVALATAAACALLVLPWMGRNSAQVGSFALNTNGGISLLTGDLPQWGGASALDAPASLRYLPKEVRDVSLEEKAQSAGPRFIRERPEKVLRLWTRKFARIWITDISIWTHYLLPSNTSAFLNWLRQLTFVPLVMSAVPYMLVVALGLGGLTLSRSFPARRLYRLLFWFAILAVLTTYGVPRDHFLFMPALLLGAAAIFQPRIWKGAAPRQRVFYLILLGLFGTKWLYLGLSLAGMI